MRLYTITFLVIIGEVQKFKRQRGPLASYALSVKAPYRRQDLLLCENTTCICSLNRKVSIYKNFTRCYQIIGIVV